MSTDHHLREVSYQLLAERGGSLEAIAELVLFLQNDYIPNLTMAECLESVEACLQNEKCKTLLSLG